MQKGTLVTLLILLVVAIAAVALLAHQKTSTEPTGPEPKVAIDLYPLYTDAEWNKAAAEDVTIGTTTYSGASVASVSLDAGMDPGSVFTPFEEYYDQLLKGRGWTVANDLAAGGAVGGETGYRNGPGVILVRYHIDYQNVSQNAPLQCPCTVSLSLFSNVGD